MPSPPPRPGLPHMPALDGLRGAAVLGVMLFHDGRLRGGYLGVDLFFVLSGFLITSLIVAEHAATGSVDLAAFWARRARRLLPALFALLPAVALYAATIADPSELPRIRSDGLATIAYAANWHTILAARSYWDLFRAPSLLAHTWSLAIEEQFYAVWPLSAALVLRRARDGRRTLLAVSVVLAIASAAALAWLFVPGHSERAYQGTDTRGAALLLGAALSCLWPPARALGDRAVRALDVAGVLAAIGLGLAWARLDGEDARLYRGGLTLTEVAVLALIACARAGDRSLVARALAARPLVGVGLVSYGVYLWHWPIFVALSPARTGLGAGALTLARFAATFAIAIASYRLLEQPIRTGRLRVGNPFVVVPAAMGLAAIALVLSTWGARTPEEAANAAGVRALPGGVPEGARKVLVLGDSVAVTLGERLRAVHASMAGAPFVVARGNSSCSLLHDQLPTRAVNGLPHVGGDCDARWVHDAEELRPDATLVVLGGGFFAPVEVDGVWQRPCDRGWQHAYRAELTRDLEALRAHGGHRVVALAPYPTGKWTKAAGAAMVDCFNATLRDAAAASPHVTVVDLSAQLCPEGRCALESDGALIRPDGLHFEGHGAESIARWMLGELSTIVDAPP
ncbi:acyltransferase family protein [Minicystis rosea]|nr:acyltransferase family protein [Minicystis rosea]